MQRLKGMDASFLYMETPTSHFHVVGTIIVDPSGVDDFSVERLKQLLMERIHLLPPFRRRLVEVPFKIARPLWIEDEAFDIDQHIRRVAVPNPGSMVELAELVGDIASRPLDRRKPLWEMWYVEGLEDGNIALVSKMHHAAIDGVSGADLMVHLFDLTPEVATYDPPEVPWQGEEQPSDFDLVTHALASVAQRPAEMWRMASSLVGATRGMASTLLANRDDSKPSAALPFTAPHTPFNGALTAHRAVAYGGVALDDMKRIKNALGGTINDVVLAATCGGLRDWLVDHDGLPDQPLVVSCPVSIGGGGDGPVETNLVSSMFVALPVQVDDSLERYELIKESTKGAKELHGALGAETIMQLAESAPPALANLAARLYSSSKLADRHRPVQNLVVSNVPGPPIPLYCAGGRVLATYPMGPLIEGSGLNVTVLSNMGNLDVGVMACPELAPDVQDLADGFEREVEALLRLADKVDTPATTPTPRKRATKKSTT